MPSGPTENPSRLRRVARVIVRAATTAMWHAFATWLALAIYFSAPLPYLLRIVLALASAALFVFAWRRSPRWRLGALAWFFVYTFYHFVLLTPPQDVRWAADHAVLPTVTLAGDRVTVANARRFSWRNKTDFTPGYYDATYDAGKITSMHYAVAPFGLTGSLAHVFLSFGFEDGQYVAVSVEARRQLGQAYKPIPSAFRQYQLMYVIGDERDILGLRAVGPGRIQFYPARSTADARRAIFLDMMRRARDLQQRPEFYNLLTSNCMSNLMVSLRKLPGLQLPGEARLLLSGFSDEAAFELGYLDTPLPFEQAREAFRIDDRVRRHINDADFSARIR